MATKISKATILQEVGDPAALDRELQQFRRAARVLSSKHPRMIEAYPKQWIGVYRGKVAASGRTLQSILLKLDKKAIPRGQAIIRFIDTNERTMIL